MNALAADLIDLGVAINFADRWAPKTNDFSRTIQVHLPVRHFGAFNEPALHKCLEDALWWFTNDKWSFEFTRFQQIPRLSELQQPLMPSSNKGIVTECALWSGGLDALAGLCNRIHCESAQRFLLVGASPNKRVLRVQKDVLKCLVKHLEADLHLARIRINQKGTKQLAARANKKLRSRAAVFMLLGSAYAYLEGEHTLYMYENGPGALNLPYRSSEIGLARSRAVHPNSLLAMGQLVSMILDQPFQICNPFLGWTKAEMCQVLDEMNVIDTALMTESCDRPHRKGVSQCGRCSSCLLRRQSFVVAGVEDRTKYLIHEETGAERENLLRKSHLPHMMYQARSLRKIFQRDDAWEVLKYKHSTLLGDIPYRLSETDGQDTDDTVDKIVNVLRRYADEWKNPSVIEAFEAEIQDINRS